MANVKLTRLKIEKYRNVAPGTELVFNDTFNIPLGQNGTGKTTLLDLIAMVVKSDFATLKDEEFSFEFELCFPSAVVASARIENRYRKREGTTTKTVGLWSVNMSNVMGEKLEWECSVAVGFKAEVSFPMFTFWGNSHNSSVQVGTSNPLDTTEDFTIPLFSESLMSFIFALSFALSSSNFLSPNPPIEQDLQRRSAIVAAALGASAQTQLNLRQNAGRFDEALGGFDAITGSNSGPRGGDLLNAGLIIIREKEQVEPIWFFVPEEVREHSTQQATLTVRPEGVRLNHSELPFLQNVVKIFNAKSADILLHLIKKEVSEGREKASYSNFEFIVTLDDGTAIRHDLLSYGQKRLLSFFYYVAAIRDIVIADELVNGLHYDWIEACLREIGDRQSFLTSQNPLLLDFLEFESAEQVKRTFILCRTEKRDGKSFMVWSNMSDETAETFFRAYKTEALQVNEILRSRGLW
jgi:energy-coupling factor transporter ATP-binding protein EcfA2